jgi:site-specific recombinase XerD
MVQLEKATVEGRADGIPPGFQFLLGEDMTLLEEPNLYLYETCVVSGTVTSLDSQRTYAESLYDWFQTCEDNGWKWDEVSQNELVGYRNRMLEEPSPATNRPYSRGTINQRLREVCRFYRWAHQKKLVSELPFSFKSAWSRMPIDRHMMAHLGGGEALRNKLTLPGRPKTLKSFSPREISLVLEALGPSATRPTRDRLMAEAALVMGLRRKEVCGLTLDQLPKQRSGLARIVLSVTKGARERAVYPPSQFLERLRWYIDLERTRLVKAMKKKLKLAYTEPNQVFLTDAGVPVQRTYLTKLFKAAAKRVGCDSATFHGLRHTFALTMFKELDRQPNINPWKALQVLLGHAQLSTTTDIYLEALTLDEAMLSDSVEALYDAALRGR